MTRSAHKRGLAVLEVTERPAHGARQWSFRLARPRWRPLVRRAYEGFAAGRHRFGQVEPAPCGDRDCGAGLDDVS
jgi:hypothetical protein